MEPLCERRRVEGKHTDTGVCEEDETHQNRRKAS